jgi:hypothetical protein|tara:strand:+ start:1848 stop:2738 length:891 start_codon:yes stop_codon:yes gene_type:complete
MPTSHYFPQYHKGFSGEQDLYQDLVDEQIKLYGTDIYYLPRKVISDGVLDDIIRSEFNNQFQIEMLLQNVEGFGENNEFISKFGLRITDEIVFRVSSRRWESSVQEYNSIDIDVLSRPNEGDLLYYPLTGNLYEIKFVNKENPFYQFGKIQFYKLTAELYEMGSDSFNLPVGEIVENELELDPSITLVLAALNGTGTYEVGELVTGSSSGSTGRVASWDATTYQLETINNSGDFAVGETITGSSSNAAYTLESFDTLDIGNTNYDQNRQIEDSGDDIIDWTETNPFGEYGNFTGSI